MFNSLLLDEPQPTCTLTVNDREITAVEGESLAAALLKAGVRQFRVSASRQEARAPYCMMGVCFECLVEVDGQPNVQSCLTPVRAGMRVRTATGEKAS